MLKNYWARKHCWKNIQREFGIQNTVILLHTKVSSNCIKNNRRNDYSDQLNLPVYILSIGIVSLYRFNITKSGQS